MPIILLLGIPITILFFISTIFLYYTEMNILQRLEEINPEKRKELLWFTGRANPLKFLKFLKTPETEDKYILKRTRICRIVSVISAVPAILFILTIIVILCLPL